MKIRLRYFYEKNQVLLKLIGSQLGRSLALYHCDSNFCFDTWRVTNADYLLTYLCRLWWYNRLIISWVRLNFTRQTTVGGIDAISLDLLWSVC